MGVGRRNRDYDWPFLFIYMAIVVLGLVNMYSSTYKEDAEFSLSMNLQAVRQGMWFIVSLVIGFLITLLDVEFIKRNSYYFYGFILLLLALVLFLPASHGAHSWIGIGGFGIQPSEFAKSATAMALAMYLSSGTRIKDFFTKIIAAGIVLIPGALILLQPDPGTFLVFLSFLFVLYREGLSGNWLLYLFSFVILNIMVLLLAGQNYLIPFTDVMLASEYFLLTGVVLIGLVLFWFIRKRLTGRSRRQFLRFLWFGVIGLSVYIFSVNWVYNNVLKDRHRNRIDIVLQKVDIDDREIALGIGYNVRNSQSAIGSGGFSGKGYMNSELANARAKLVPEQSTDFIFCTYAEEWGFLGAAVLLVLYSLLIIRSFMIAERQRSTYARIFGYSVGFIFFFHVLINVAMVSGIAPVIGIPLVFMSYGGSSLIAFSFLVFILFKLDSERMNVLS